MFKSKLDYTKFKVFGCACYLLLCIYNNHKLYFRLTCFFLSYSLHNKGYMCLSLYCKTFISCHVIFNEDNFPFSNKNNPFTNAMILPCLLITLLPLVCFNINIMIIFLLLLVNHIIPPNYEQNTNDSSLSSNTTTNTTHF